MSNTKIKIERNEVKSSLLHSLQCLDKTNFVSRFQMLFDEVF